MKNTLQKTILKALKNKEEFSVEVANKVQAEVVKTIMSEHGLESTGEDAIYRGHEGYVHYFVEQGFWCTSCKFTDSVFEFNEFVDVASWEDNSKPEPVQHSKQETQQEVKYKHFRKYNKVIKMSGVDHQVSNLGGFTLAFHECPNDEVAVAMAFCCDEDNFNREVGRQVSRKRLFSRPFLMMNYELEELLRMSYEEVLEHTEFSHMYKIAMGRV